MKNNTQTMYYVYFWYKPLQVGLLSYMALSLIACSANHPEPNVVDQNQSKRESIDLLRIVYEVAEENNMYVMSELNMGGGNDLYEKHSAAYMENQYKIFIQRYHNRYGRHKSFWGWYLNHEINPLKPDEVNISGFWRKIWKTAVDECKRVAPQSVVSISPFFLLDRNSYRGFEYLQPVEYERWWSKTLTDTGIDILMLQDSGAEHLGFFTLEDRRPFFEAFKNACDQAGSQLWLNVETGEVDAKNWPEAIQMESTGTQKWVYTHTDWLAQKLALAAEYGEHIINWGYYPYMHAGSSIGPYPSDNTSQSQRESNYASYKVYYEEEVAKPAPTKGPKPVMRGTLWWLPVEVSGWSAGDLEKAIRFQIEKQAEIGFDIIWILNAPANMQRAIENEMVP